MEAALGSASVMVTSKGLGVNVWVRESSSESVQEVEPEAGSLKEPRDERLPAEGCPDTLAVSVHEVETKLDTPGAPEPMGETVTVVAAIKTVLRSVS